MPIELPDLQYLKAAEGYVALGMLIEADRELDKIDPLNRAAPECLALRVEIYRGLKKWELMREISRRLHEFNPDELQWIISYAFATRRAVSIGVAKDILLKSIANFPKEGLVFFNLACYDCQLGNFESAKD